MNKTNKITHVYGNDGGGLYINGKLISSYFTTVQADILIALGVETTDNWNLNQKWYDDNNLPENLDDIPDKAVKSKTKGIFG